jgi:Uma2 family endonuclease
MSAVPSPPPVATPAPPKRHVPDITLTIPTSAMTVAGFRVWATSPEYPERGRIALIGKELFIDMSPERLDSHAKVKNEIGRVLSNLILEGDLGIAYPDGTLVVNEPAELSNEPDFTFVSWGSHEAGRCHPVPSATEHGDFTELEGTPDCVVEVVSPGSVRKDTQRLREVYHRAGIPEYWLIDARGDEVLFEILVHQADGFAAVPRRGKWQRSQVFARLFHFERSQDRLGGAQYRLHSRR